MIPHEYASVWAFLIFSMLISIYNALVYSFGGFLKWAWKKKNIREDFIVELKLTALVL